MKMNELRVLLNKLDEGRRMELTDEELKNLSFMVVDLINTINLFKVEE